MGRVLVVVMGGRAKREGKAGAEAGRSSVPAHVLQQERARLPRKERDPSAL